MAAAYAYADGVGPMPRELVILNSIDRYGVKAVLGRDVLGAKEMRRMAVCDNIKMWYDARKRDEKWSESHVNESNFLTEIHRMADELGYFKVRNA